MDDDSPLSDRLYKKISQFKWDHEGVLTVDRTFVTEKAHNRSTIRLRNQPATRRTHRMLRRRWSCCCCKRNHEVTVKGHKTIRPIFSQMVCLLSPVSSAHATKYITAKLRITNFMRISCPIPSVNVKSMSKNVKSLSKN